MGNNIDITEARSNEEILNDSQKDPQIEEILNALKEVENSDTDTQKGKVASLSDEVIDKLLSNITLSDSEGRNYVFYSEDEAMIYASGLQVSHPSIRFCQINKCFGLKGGIFYTITPMTTELSENMTDEELKGPAEDLIHPSLLVFLLIIERASRLKKQRDEEKEKENLSNNMSNIEEDIK